MSQKLCHNDGVSATTIFDDGTIAYWTIGGNEVYLKDHEDTLMLTRIDVQEHPTHPILQTPELARGLADEIRPMTPDEEWSWNCKGIKRPRRRG